MSIVIIAVVAIVAIGNIHFNHEKQTNKSLTF